MKKTYMMPETTVFEVELQTLIANSPVVTLSIEGGTGILQTEEEAEGDGLARRSFSAWE